MSLCFAINPTLRQLVGEANFPTAESDGVSARGLGPQVKEQIMDEDASGMPKKGPSSFGWGGGSLEGLTSYSRGSPFSSFVLLPNLETTHFCQKIGQFLEEKNGEGSNHLQYTDPY